MSDFLPLGKAIPKPAAAPAPDEYERFTGAHGDRLMRNKRTGAIETAPPRKLPEPEVIYTTEQWDAMIGSLLAQDAEFPLNEFGSL